MKTIFNIILFLFFSSEYINSQVTQQWVQRYNYFSEDEAHAIAVDKVGNVYVTGRSEAYSPNGAKPDYATIKYNSSGIQQWVQRYNGPGNDFDSPIGIAVDDSGNVYITGTSNRIVFPGSPDYDIATIKYNTNGAQQWLRRYDGGNDEAASAGILLDKHGNIYIGGREASIGFLVLKYNSNGDTLWIRTFNNNGTGAAAIGVDTSGNVYLTGSNPAQDWLTVKWNTQGVFQWAQTFNGPGSGADYAQEIAVSDSGNVYVTGYVWGNNNTDYATIKYNSSGVQQWVVFYNGGFGDGAWSVISDNSGNVYVTGQSSSGGSNLDYLTIKYSAEGIQQWASRFNGPANSYDVPYSIKLDTGDNIYVTGYATVSTNNRDYCTIKYNNSGVQQWVIYYSGTGGSQNPYDGATALAVDEIGNVYVTGSSGGSGNQDYATIKYTQTTGIKQISSEIPSEFKLYQNYPNPFNPVTHLRFEISGLRFVSLKIYDILGSEIATLVNEELKPGTYEADFDASNYPSGIYYYTLTADYPSAPLRMTKKMVLIK